MNLALVTSYIIAAMLMLSIIMMNLNLSSSSAELTLTQITRQHMVTVADMLNDDIPNMGYNVDEKTEVILEQANNHRIRFYRNIQDDETREPERITWVFNSDPILPADKNQNIGLLTRRVLDPNNADPEEVTEIRTGVTKFHLRYYDKHGAPLDSSMVSPVEGASLQNVKQIYLELEMQSAEPLHRGSGPEGDRYIRTVYEKRFSPRNLD